MEPLDFTPHPMVTPKFFVVIFTFFNISRMQHVLTIKSCGKGGFAIPGDIKVKKGAFCSLRRNPGNVHSKFFKRANS